ncbi:MAG TPA: ABC transporter permease [Pseudonocardiaceae bacterium]|jgi:NitT/TauT family transport system permease protein|nr:ABC transporter permease [Pseudonocardiaceae bacterium]
MRKPVRGLIGLAGFLVLWELASLFGVFDAKFVPSPVTVVSNLVNLFGQQEFVTDLVATVLAWLISIALAAVIAIPLGLVLGSIRVVRETTSAVVEFLRPVPSVALIPVVMAAFGDGPQTKIIAAVFAAVWPILFNVIYGLGEIDPQYVATAKVYRTGWLRTALSVRLPHVLPFAITGLRLSAAISLIVIVSTEFLSGSGIGIGSYFFQIGEDTGNMPLVVTGVVLAGILGSLINSLLVAVQNRWLTWTPGSEAA